VAALVAPRRVAEMVTSVDDFGRLVEIVNVLLVTPAGTVMLET